MPPSMYLMLDSMQGSYLIHGSCPVARGQGFGVRLPASLLVCALTGPAADLPYFSVLSDE